MKESNSFKNLKADKYKTTVEEDVEVNDIRGYYKYSFVKQWDSGNVLLRLKRTATSEYEIINITKKNALEEMPAEPPEEYLYGDIDDTGI